MIATPILYEWMGDGWRPANHYWAKRADEQFVIGETAILERVEERSEVSHRHEFAWLKEAWQSLPDALTAEYPSSEHLRKKALIATGWCDVRDYAVASRAEAIRLAATLRGELDDYTVVIVREAVVRVCRAKSQSRNKMRAADFQASKQAVLEHVASLLGVTPETLSRQTEAA